MRVTTKGQVTIPKEIRDRLGIEPGSEVDFVADQEGARIVPIRPAQTPEERAQQFKQWLDRVAGTIDLDGMTTDEYMEWLRGPRDDLDPR
ncbi:AbrB/MazE/SpoVT family DNA-binding domain-containing protein [Aminobacter sp. AP02]|uniref:AbrB/MazE/SpoVT family DNA-binding domain-containing protein n=1 Tax=Aminobacter sp. AP02 TaxID=2135737 RepID=UPI000D6D2C09|nr:AbrB/MazE/SpoVT family DNA-binding domain-containing protein [Aminobacter sp. AP02]PWK63556.1 AbrB family looped-hinge helix DNA binding protein [Aminobacter sp. AP02]